MATHTFPPKDSTDVLDYTFDLTQVLATTEQLVGAGTSSVWTVAPAGPTILLQELVSGNKAMRVWLSGGTPGIDYTLTAKATSNNAPNARVWERNFILPVRNL